MAADITYQQLQRDIQALAKDVRKDAEAIQTEAAALATAAQDTARVADQIAALHVAPATVAETQDLSREMTGVTAAARGYASAADTTARHAEAAEQQTRATHGGINEAVARSPEHAGNPVWYRLD